MTTPPLSPAAEKIAWSQCPRRDGFKCAPSCRSCRKEAAATLIAAADQVVPEEFTHRSPCREHCIIGGAAERIRSKLLALAAELRQEGQS